MSYPPWFIGMRMRGKTKRSSLQLRKREKIIDYDKGLIRGYHTPFEDEFQKFAYELTMIQDNIIRGIRQMMEIVNGKAKRGGPMFFLISYMN